MTVKKTRDTMTRSLNKITKQLPKNIAKAAYEYFKKVTPKRSGNAKRRTRLNKQVIQAQYPYAKRLDKGWSKQAPDGMTEPTLEHLKRNRRKYIRK